MSEVEKKAYEMQMRAMREVMKKETRKIEKRLSVVEQTQVVMAQKMDRELTRIDGKAVCNGNDIAQLDVRVSDHNRQIKALEDRMQELLDQNTQNRGRGRGSLGSSLGPWTGNRLGS